MDQTASEVGISVGSCHSTRILQCVERKLHVSTFGTSNADV